MTAALNALQAHYDAMWADAFAPISAGAVDVDPTLAPGADARRGLTLIALPGAALAAQCQRVLDRLCGAEPDQFRYPSTDLHVTILSLVTVAVDSAPQLARLDDYRAAVRAALGACPTWEIAFDGITLSRGAVMARGMPHGPALETLRVRLRTELHARGLGASLDRRYRLVTAHATLLRFVAPLREPARFAALLAGLRDVPLGSMRVDTLALVINDWCMSGRSRSLVDTLALAGPVSAPALGEQA